MFRLDYHNKILTILKAMNTELLLEVGACFGGGTLLTLTNGEYRWSKDIDLICPVGEGYRKLRAAINQSGYKALFNRSEALSFPRDIKADQYGIRFGVKVEDLVIKVEFIAEARITLGEPVYQSWCGVPCLNFDDACAEKLLSNADRWADASVESRDLIDLSVLRSRQRISELAFTKAEAAYPVLEPLAKSIDKFQRDDRYRERCFSSLKIDSTKIVMNGLEGLRLDLDSFS